MRDVEHLFSQAVKMVAEYNPRKITDKKLEELKTSLKEFGVVQPLIVNTYSGRENIVVGGHNYPHLPSLFKRIY